MAGRKVYSLNERWRLFYLMTSLFLVKLKKRWPDESESQQGGWRFKKKREVIKTLKKNRLSELFENTVEAENHAIQLVPIFTFV